ncbi:helix-turn-helix domain-containing protein [Pseudomonas oryzihabitans]|uniref:helix-turn-helix domain-containing protein n=1 Tax=Pseudomonas oryzihabitans TaxID=47885 RepID=UPI0009ECF8CB|nr:helix-turn-helix domain-containing protein [Pseudomonas oryzihabitans]
MEMLDVPLDLDRRWEWIKYQLRVRGTSGAAIARELCLHDRAIRSAKRNAYPRVERAIADALELQPIQIWPERWNSDGTPKRLRPNRAESNANSVPENTGYCPVGEISGQSSKINQAKNGQALAVDDHE